MAFRDNKEKPVDFDSLQVTLVNSKLQQSNPSLYLTLSQLIAKLRQNRKQIEQEFTTIIGNIDIDTSNNLQAILRRIVDIGGSKFLTWGNESQSLLNSRELVAGQGVEFDDTVLNSRIINVISGGFVPMTTGVEPMEIMSNGNGEVLLIAYNG